MKIAQTKVIGYIIGNLMVDDTTDTGLSDILIIKLDKNGAITWEKRIG